MRTFYEKIDLRNKKEMINFLEKHFRYDTMNSWNCSTSYAHNMKIYNLQFGELEDKIYSIMETDDFNWAISDLISDFEMNHNYGWQAGFNGRSGGYLVLYQGGQKPSDYKSFCTACGQRNYQSVNENGNRCGVCRKETRVDYQKVPMQKFSYPGRSTDMDEDFDEWDMKSLKERVKLVQEFDQLADDIIATVVELAKNHEVEEETYFVPQTRKVLV